MGQSDADAAKEVMLRGGQEQKVAQTDPSANYMGPDQGPFKCSACEYFQQPSSCQKVDGVIDAEGCCNLFSKGDNDGDEAQVGSSGQGQGPKR